MATATIKLAPIDLDRRRHLRMDFNALATAEELTGRSFIAKGAWDNVGAREIRALLFGCLRHEDATLTLDAVGALLHPGNIGAVTESLKNALDGAMPEQSEEEVDTDDEPGDSGKAPPASIT